jgi:arsenate reductase-like glutaredoxin family protein
MYRLRKMKENPPTRAEALKLMAQEPNLIRRPIVIRGGQMILGYDEEGLRKLAKEPSQLIEQRNRPMRYLKPDT